MHGRTIRHVLMVLLSVRLPTVAADQQSPEEASTPSAEAVRFFETHIRPLLLERCCECHGDSTQESDLRLDTLSGMLNGGAAGPAVVPGKPDSSLLITAVRYHDNDLRMPPDEKLSERQIENLVQWVQQGAPHPDSGSVVPVRPRSTIDMESARSHWAFLPLAAPDLPETASPSSQLLDVLINRRLAEQGLSPNAAADRLTLIRRAAFDLLGLPPTPDEIDAYLADSSPGAFERVIDRLLDSPHYGERWGRHWLDVARYADSNGLDENVAHGNAWRYRDYVVQSLNRDKPYDEFVVEQLAGDLLDAGDNPVLRRERLIATGFLVLGPKVLAEVDKAKLEMDIVDEQLDTVGRSLMGLTLGCARCHDHKFDPIGADDYYALAGIFKSTRTMETLKTVARWHENTIALPDDRARLADHKEQISAAEQDIADMLAAARAELPAATDAVTEEEIEQQFPEETRAALKSLRDRLKELIASTPALPTAMGVVDGDVADTSIHLRGSHLTLGETVARRFPRALAGDQPPQIPSDHSGRLEFARWLTNDAQALTARVMVNRIWRWHFGRGLVETVDNFGMQGTPPTHPELLDWLAIQFVKSGWSIKAMHRIIMSSETYRRSSDLNAGNAAIDADNRFYWRSNVRRLEAEVIRDSLLAVSGTLDRTLGGNLLTTGNREYLFNHTSQDRSTYRSIRRRSIYVPVIRNHLYDMFQLFDYTDASVLNGNRETSTIAPQALFLMNSEFVEELTLSMARRLRAADASLDDAMNRLFREAYGRPPAAEEVSRAREFLAQFEQLVTENDNACCTPGERAWQALCQSVVSSSEFVYVR